MKPGSIASEAARLTIELGILVTPDKIRWWRKKLYPMDDTPALLECVRNQERIAGDSTAFKTLREKSHRATETAPEIDDADDGPPAMARLIITNKMIADAKGSIPMGEVLDYLRDQWEADEWHCPKRFANKSEAEIEQMVKRDIAWNFSTLPDLMPSVSLPACPDWVHSMIFPSKTAESPDSLQGGDDAAPDSMP